MDCDATLRRESLAYEGRHNGQYRYSALKGQTPLAALGASAVSLRFPPTPEPPKYPLPKPKKGRYHLVRFIRSERILDVFGERFSLHQRRRTSTFARRWTSRGSGWACISTMS